MPKAATGAKIGLVIKETNGDKTAQINILIGNLRNISYYGHTVIDRYRGDYTSNATVDSNSTITLDCNISRCTCGKQ